MDIQLSLTGSASAAAIQDVLASVLNVNDAAVAVFDSTTGQLLAYGAQPAAAPAVSTGRRLRQTVSVKSVPSEQTPLVSGEAAAAQQGVQAQAQQLTAVVSTSDPSTLQAVAEGALSNGSLQRALEAIGEQLTATPTITAFLNNDGSSLIPGVSADEPPTTSSSPASAPHQQPTPATPAAPVSSASASTGLLVLAAGAAGAALLLAA